MGQKRKAMHDLFGHDWKAEAKVVLAFLQNFSLSIFAISRGCFCTHLVAESI